MATNWPSCRLSAEAEMACAVRLLDQSFDPAAELAAFSAAHAQAGGIASFLGQVRAGANEHGDVEALELQHYGPLTLPGMQALAADALRRWSLEGLLIVHRAGLMHPGDPIVLVAAAARHRRDAFAAADFAMDHLKSESWFWKREKRAGQWHWIEPRGEDYTDKARWA
jgi:molybdopterin synthase catalytic subunit